MAQRWALIALLCYILTLHGRLAGWWTQFGLVVASVVCFLAVLMAWYGVNFVLGKGLHSYGFGLGGETLRRHLCHRRSPLRRLRRLALSQHQTPAPARLAHPC